jgi:hypothetical protein
MGLRARNILREVMKATFDQMSINHYLAVFGAVPETRPYRQWLCDGRDSYIHIARVWADPALRERMLARLRRDRRCWKLCGYVERDLERLDAFAARFEAGKRFCGYICGQQ